MYPIHHSLSPDELPSWGDISSLSDEELFALYDACENRLTSVDKSTSVRRIASDVVVKAGAIRESEWITMILVHETTTVLVPAVRRVLHVNERKGFVMDYIPGQTVNQCWHNLGLWQRFSLFWTLRSYIKQLRRVSIPGKPRSEHVPGPIGHEPQLCLGGMFSPDYGAGPFASYDALKSWFRWKLHVNRKVRKYPTEAVKFDFSLPLALTHLDISSYNILVDKESRIWMIDWEHSGFYPQWFEYIGMYNNCWVDQLGKWHDWIVGFVTGFYRKQAVFISMIGWALTTGVFL
ncbi:hypothetical protein AGABI1DRAFT_107424 [Agaricus bisporus var. burnettii JB137-S8]|uniref:Aminoglycoside phosphotransferase domain-containing protein n=1 Tax=Agaricus bisporus var. burnettii (strain JB137-S8 / ATCC MYA-4627 / FGSC 10392) TaxID=597362 RepID=K5VX23_AGABU|nr:uncharacterized protein AGABI1DRAFT_107424 [Agaricus bisporus var. burnettii JB137-S8]EKM79024.1 hypothetical protein AGABI1DRAFT_107424 [Agaricus bisporus var. burnettii JB137-S8]